MKLAMVAAVVAIATAAALLLAMPSGSGSEKKTVTSGADLTTVAPLNLTSLNQSATNVGATEQAPDGNYSMGIYVDKYTYFPRDTVDLTMNITVPGRIENAEIRFFGVKSKFGVYTMQRSMNMTLIEGLNVINTKTNIPACTPCSGLVTPAVYQMHGAVRYNGAQLVNATTEIEIKENAE